MALWAGAFTIGAMTLFATDVSGQQPAQSPGRYPLPSRIDPPVPSLKAIRNQLSQVQYTESTTEGGGNESYDLGTDPPVPEFGRERTDDLGRTYAVRDPWLSDGVESLPTPTDAPPEAVLWWDKDVYEPLRQVPESLPVTLEQILVATLQSSHYVDVIKEIPLIRETSIMEADAQFDWISFVETQWNDISQPVGSRLTTGGPPRYRDHNVTAQAGVRRRNQTGGQFEIGQRIGHQNTNSVFFVPQDQATSRLTINYTQPLLRNAGRAYNTSLTVLAQIETAAAQDELSRNLQAHLVQVTEAYWGLYLERANLLQKQRFLNRAADILEELDRRRDIDALQSQIVRARAAVASRRAEIVRSRTEIQNAESRLRALVNDPRLGDGLMLELIPQDQPSTRAEEIDLRWSVETALQNRPEVGQSIKQIRAAGVRQRIAENEILPQLNAILEMYASGLRGASNLGGSLTDQFATGEPSYSVGLQYEMPIWNRAAKARYNRRRMELRQLEAQFRATAANLTLEVERAVREVTTTYQEMLANFGAMQAADAEVNYIFERWQLLPGS
ncbi:MAG: TolC family protein, partial [Planctomycetales bacterium]|nr:TolC family protein [Planctomycetales bacterium]